MIESVGPAQTSQGRAEDFSHDRQRNQGFGYKDSPPYSKALIMHICFSHIERRKYSFFFNGSLINLCAR